MGALIVLAVVGFVLLLMRLAAPVLAPVMFSFYLAALALPFFQWLLRRGVARGIALIVLLVTLVVGGGALFVLVLAGVGHLQAGLQTYGEQLSSRVAELQAALSQSGVTMPVTSGQASAAATAILGELLRAIANAASTALVSIVVVVFFLLESDFWAWLLGPIGALLSMPITVLLMLVLQQDEGTRWIAQIIGREA